MSSNNNIVYAFIDSQNINLGTLADGWKLDWGKFRLFLRNKYGVKKAFLFIGYIKKNISLYDYLEKVGFILIFKNVLAIHKDHKVIYKGNVDAELVLHAVTEIPNYDQAIIASGDGDFYCLVEYLNKKKRLKKILTPNERYSSLLKRYSGYIVNMEKFKKKLCVENKRRGIPAVNKVNLW
jgi:uncharacterized LabA/DUF88 family protein